MRRLLLLLPFAVSACAAPPREEAPAGPVTPVAAEARPPAADAEAWQVTNGRLEVRVYRDGPMQKFGHNHLITSQQIAGEIALREPLASSRFSLHLPLDSLVVDDDAARARAGEAFAAPVPESDREATRRNLLGERLLDAARQGEVRLAADSITGGSGRYQARVRVSLAGREHVLAVPFALTRDGARLVARASFRLTHADLGLEPFAVALGALKVRDDFDVELAIEARRRT